MHTVQNSLDLSTAQLAATTIKVNFTALIKEIKRKLAHYAHKT
jgi:hypothetical protein